MVELGVRENHLALQHGSAVLLDVPQSVVAVVHVHGDLMYVEVLQQPGDVLHLVRLVGDIIVAEGDDIGGDARKANHAVIVEVAAVGDDGLEQERRGVVQPDGRHNATGIGHLDVTGAMCIHERRLLCDLGGSEGQRATTAGIIVLEVSSNRNLVGVVGCSRSTNTSVPLFKRFNIEGVVLFENPRVVERELEQIAILHHLVRRVQLFQHVYQILSMNYGERPIT